MSANVRNPEISRYRGGGNKKEAALAALLSEPTHKMAAELCGISAKTLQRWLKEESFASAFQAAKLELVEGMGRKLRLNGWEAAETLREVYKNPQPPPGSSARVAAARATIELAQKAHTVEDIEVRLARIETERGNDNERF